MEYDELIAIQVLSMNRLSKQSLVNWKWRNTIPNRYFNPDGTIKAVANKDLKGTGDSFKQKRVIDVLSKPYYNKRIILDSVGIVPTRFFEVRKGKSSFTESEIDKLAFHVRDIRAKCESALRNPTPEKIRGFFQDEQRLRLRPLLGGDTRLANAVRYSDVLVFADLSEVKEYAKEFIKETTLWKM